MLDWMFIIICIMAVILMIFSIKCFKEGDYFWAFTLSMICIVFWFLLSASVLEIEKPYEYYNATTNQVETGTHIITSKVAPEMVLLFQLPGYIMVIFNMVIVFVTISDWWKNKKNSKIL